MVIVIGNRCGTGDYSPIGRLLITKPQIKQNKTPKLSEENNCNTQHKEYGKSKTTQLLQEIPAPQLLSSVMSE